MTQEVFTNLTDSDSRNANLIVEPQGQALAENPQTKAVSPLKRSKKQIVSKMKKMRKQIKTCLGKYLKHKMVHQNLRCYCSRCGLCPLGVMM